VVTRWPPSGRERRKKRHTMPRTLPPGAAWHGYAGIANADLPRSADLDPGVAILKTLP
jgi:hypothetical protein